MMHCGYFDTTQKGNHSAILTLAEVGGRRPFHLKSMLKVIDPLKNADLTDFRL